MVKVNHITIHDFRRPNMDYHVTYNGDIIASFEHECDRDTFFDVMQDDHEDCAENFEKSND